MNKMKWHINFKYLKLLFSLMIVSLLCGCWDIKEIENINYVTAIGIDYEDKKYVLYAQLLDFTAVAKTETGKSDKPAQVWVGKAKGETVHLAMNSLYATSQERTSWSHVTSIVFSENALKQGGIFNNDLIIRDSKIRLTPWLYGTREPMEKLFVAPAFFNVSPLNTISHEPLQAYLQSSYIPPIRFLAFNSRMNEPASTVLLPNLSITSSVWEKNEKKDAKMYVDGAFSLSEKKLEGWLSRQKLLGIRWGEKDTTHTPLNIAKNGETVAVISLEDPKIRKSVKLVDGKPKFELDIKLTGSVTEILGEVNKDEIEEMAAAKVKKEILTTYQSGMKIQSDLFNLKHVLYKQKTAAWKKMNEMGGMQLDDHSIESVNVNIYLNHAGLKMLPVE